jgi:hypothetical protein
MDLTTLATQFGIPTAISLYLVYWLTTINEKSLDEVKVAINNQTKVLNHTLTKMISQMNKDKNELREETLKNRKEYLKILTKK